MQQNELICRIQDNWKNTDLQKSVLIDTAGWYFDVHFHDMTMNGKASVKNDQMELCNESYL